jgi:hypothetical protein
LLSCPHIKCRQKQSNFATGQKLKRHYETRLAPVSLMNMWIGLMNCARYRLRRSVRILLYALDFGERIYQALRSMSKSQNQYEQEEAQIYRGHTPGVTPFRCCTT